VALTQASVQAALDDFSPSSTDSDELERYILDGPGRDSYPLSVLALVVLKKSYTAVACDGASLYMGELVWGITNSLILDDTEKLGYTPLTAAYRIRVLNQLATLKCNGQRLMKSSLLTGTGPRAPFFASYGLFYGQTVAGLTSQYFVGGDEDQLTLGNVDYVGSVNTAGSSAPANYPTLEYLYIQPRQALEQCHIHFTTHIMVCAGTQPCGSVRDHCHVQPPRASKWRAAGAGSADCGTSLPGPDHHLEPPGDPTVRTSQPEYHHHCYICLIPHLLWATTGTIRE
jgi:hypothetical protein